MMTRNLAAEVAPKVRVNAISVGGVATDALQVVLTNDELRAQFEANTPMGRAGHGRGHRRLRPLPRVAGGGVGDGQDLPDRRRHRVPRDHRAGAEALI